MEPRRLLASCSQHQHAPGLRMGTRTGDKKRVQGSGFRLGFRVSPWGRAASCSQHQHAPGLRMGIGKKTQVWGSKYTKSKLYECKTWISREDADQCRRQEAGSG